MKVSTLILTYNEAGNLPACLAALAWCDDILVLDSGSTDGTVDVARAAGCRILTRPFDTFAGQRNFGLENGDFRHPWVLHLDADEVLTSAFVAALEALDPPADIDAYHVPSKTIFMGKWLRRAGMWPSYQVRLGRRDELRFVQRGHGQREDLPSSRLAVFPEAYLHYSFSHGLPAWLRKHLKYAEDEVEEIVRDRAGEVSAVTDDGGVASRRRAIKRFAGRLPLSLRPALKFLYVYVLRGGFLDGRRGFNYAFMLAVYEGMIAVIGFERLAGPNSTHPSIPAATLASSARHRGP